MGNCHRHWVKAKSCDVVQAHKSCTTHAHNDPPLLLSRVRMRPFSVRARAPRGSSACDHLAECHAELFPLRASLRFATSTLCFSLSLSPSFILHTLEDSSIVDNRTEFRMIDRRERRRKVLKMFRTTRKLRGPVSTAPRDSSTRCPSASKHFPFDYSSHTVHREKIGDSRPTTLRGFGRIWSEPSTDRWSKR